MVSGFLVGHPGQGAADEDALVTAAGPGFGVGPVRVVGARALIPVDIWSSASLVIPRTGEFDVRRIVTLVCCSHRDRNATCWE